MAVLDVSTLLRTGQDDGETFASQLEDVLRERSSAPLLVLLNKSDLLVRESASADGDRDGSTVTSSSDMIDEHVAAARRLGNGVLGQASVLPLSCKTAAGADAVLRALQGFAESTLGGGEGAEESSIITRHRHRQLLRSCVSALLRYEVRRAATNPPLRYSRRHRG